MGKTDTKLKSIVKKPTKFKAYYKLMIPIDYLTIRQSSVKRRQHSTGNSV